jgi:metallo-beta-lactamase class B
MRQLLLAATCLLLPVLARAQSAESLAPDVSVREIADGVWLHVTVSDSASGSIAANGLIVQAGPQLVLVDTGWNSRQAGVLVDWAERTLGAPVRIAIASHSHEDRAGGLDEMLVRGVQVVVLDSTLVRLPERMRGAGIETFHGARELALGGRTLELFAPGPGHTADNIVVWLPDAELLFGGCFIKSAGSRTLGNLADADLTRWPASLRAVNARFGGARLVVPGHGDVGGRELLAHTRDLLRGKGKR